MATSVLASLLKSIPDLSLDELPGLLGELETAKTLILLRLFAPAPASAPDQLLDVPETAQRMGVSEDYLYRHSKQFPFSRRMGRKLLFSARGVEAHIRDQDSNTLLTARQHRRKIGLAS